MVTEGKEHYPAGEDLKKGALELRDQLNDMTGALRASEIPSCPYCAGVRLMAGAYMSMVASALSMLIYTLEDVHGALEGGHPIQFDIPPGKGH